MPHNYEVASDGSENLQNTLWHRFLRMCTTAPELLCLVCKRLSSSDQQALRRVNSDMRRAINSTVTCICWDENRWRVSHGLPHQQLHHIFPNLTSLSVGHPDNWQVALAHLRLLTHAHSTNLAKLQHLGLMVPHYELLAANTASIVWETLNRCTNLVRLSLHTVDRTYRHSNGSNEFSVMFTGAGTDPKAQALSLQRQVAAFQATPGTFLAPSSWPFYGCLTRFQHSRFTDPDHPWADTTTNEQVPHTSHPQHAMQTTSLQYLNLLNSEPLSLPTAAHITFLTNITHLQFTTRDPNPLLNSLAALPLLRDLHIKVSIDNDTIAAPPVAAMLGAAVVEHGGLHHDGPSLRITIPPTWRQLTRLQSFQLSGTPAATVQLSALSLLRTLQDLSIGISAGGGLADLEQLRCLSRLMLVSPLVLPCPSHDLQGPWLSSNGPDLAEDSCTAVAAWGVAARTSTIWHATARGVTSSATEDWRRSCRAAVVDMTSPCVWMGSTQTASGNSIAAPPFNVWKQSCQASAGRIAAPAEWGSIMQVLQLAGPWPPVILLLPQLAALRVLQLIDFPVNLDLCWALASLPALLELQLHCPTNPPGNEATFLPIPEPCRPLLPSLRSVSLPRKSTSYSVCPLHILATTTRLPPGCALALTAVGEGAEPMPQVVEVHTWSRSWLKAARRVATLENGAHVFRFGSASGRAWQY